MAKERITNRPANMGRTVCRRMKGERYTMPDGPATQTSRRGVESQGPGAATATALDDEHYRRPGFLSVHPLGLPHFPRPLPECQSDPGVGAGMEANEEVALRSNDSTVCARRRDLRNEPRRLAST
jgi:hypothetical protein